MLFSIAVVKGLWHNDGCRCMGRALCRTGFLDGETECRVVCVAPLTSFCDKEKHLKAFALANFSWKSPQAEMYLIAWFGPWGNEVATTLGCGFQLMEGEWWLPNIAVPLSRSLLRTSWKRALDWTNFQLFEIHPPAGSDWPLLGLRRNLPLTLTQLWGYIVIGT